MVDLWSGGVGTIEDLDEDSRFAEEFEDRFDAALKSDIPPMTPRPNLSTATMTCILLDEHNHLIWGDPRFERWIGRDVVDMDVCDQVRANGVEQLVQTTDQDDHPLILAYAPIGTARHWPIPFKIDREGSGAGIAIGALSLAHLSDALIETARAAGLTNLEARVAAALVSHGHMRRAGAHCGVQYQTARKAASAAMRKLNVSGQAQLVRKMSELVTSVSPPREDARNLLIDIFGFTPREARLALLLAEGHDRKESAEIAGLSNAVAKDVFSCIFEKMGIEKAPEIPRVVADAFLSALFARADQHALASLPGEREPLRILHRPDGSVVAMSDYGPKDGRPVHILHSSMSTRYPFRKVVRALQNAGFRPITIDRPGYGLTDDRADADDMDDLFAAGADDVRLVCDWLGIKRIDLLTRGGAFAALATARMHPDLIGRAVVINPDLLQEHCTKRSGTLGLVRTGFERFPDRIESMLRWTGSQLTPSRIAKLIDKTLKTIPADAQSLSDAESIADYQRSFLVFATSRISGIFREQRGYVTMADVLGLQDGRDWKLLIGDADPIHDVAEMIPFWRAKLPGASIRNVQGAGRYMELSHTEAVIDALNGAIA
ncbi:alpha/beta hydrolase [Erythrobacter aureus]|nr:alpha/beta hydrolase [Erythrobacter aureus]